MDIFYYTHTKIDRSVLLTDRRLSYYDLTVVLVGQLRYVRNGEPVTVRKREMILFAPGDQRSRMQADTAEYFSFNFTTENDIDLRRLPLGHQTELLTSEILELLYLFERSHDSFSQFSAEKNEAYMRCILYSLIERASPSKNSHVVSEIKQYVAANLRENLSLSTISAALSYSATYCSNIFKRETGESLRRYIQREKMQLARVDMLQEAHPLTEIAHCVGYREYSYFSRVFKSVYGVSPTQYLRMHELRQGGKEQKREWQRMNGILRMAEPKYTDDDDVE